MADRVLRASAPDERGVRSFWMWCPACDDAVRIEDGPNGWGWNGSLDKPTFTPSILTTSGGGNNRCCHSFLTDGVWNFLGDCSHAMANQQVPMVPVPDWLFPEEG